MRGKLSLSLAALAVGVSIAACGGGDDKADTSKPVATTGAAGGGAAARIEVVTHGQASAPFWSTVKKGIDQAAKETGSDVNYQSPDDFDMVRMSQLIDAAVAKRPDGLVVSLPDPKALGPAVERAVKAGIPVVSINSGADAYKKLGILAHIGQPEYDAGYAGGERMAQAGVTKALCLNGEVGNAALDDRCRGFADALKKAGGTSKQIAVKLSDPQGTQQTTQAAIASNRPDGIFNTTNAVAIPALDAIKATGNSGKIKQATFDLGPQELQAVQKGDMLFAIDQQQYLQGYLPIVFLSLYKRYQVMPGAGGVVPTGPAFVTKDTAAKVLDLSKQGIR